MKDLSIMDLLLRLDLAVQTAEAAADPDMQRLWEQNAAYLRRRAHAQMKEQGLRTGSRTGTETSGGDEE
jgi:hypothetical protein